MQVSEAVQQAGAALFEYDPAVLQPISHGGAPDGAVYTDGRCVVKFMPLHAEKMPATEARLAFVEHLQQQGVGVPCYLRSRQGRLVEALAVGEERYAVTQALKAPGRHIDFKRDWGAVFFKRWGRAMGQMHALAVDYDAAASIPAWDEEFESFMAMCQDATILEKWQELGTTLRALPRPRTAYGPIHNDLHVMNMLLDGDAMTVLDFDVCTQSWFGLDIAIALLHPVWESCDRPLDEVNALARGLGTHFMTGYRQFYDLDPAWLDHLPEFLRYRQILFLIALLAEPDDPGNHWRTSTLRALRRYVLEDLLVKGADHLRQGIAAAYQE